MIRLNDIFLPKVFQQKITSKAYKSPAYFAFDISDLDTTNGKVYYEFNGLLHVEYDGLIEISFNLWLEGPYNSRPWLTLENYDTSTELAQFITTMPVGFATVACPPVYVINKGHTRYGIKLRDSGGNNITPNGGTGGNNASFVNVKLL